MNVARIAQSETPGKNWIQRQFRCETKTSKHHFKPPSRLDPTSLQVRLSEAASLYVCNTLLCFPVQKSEHVLLFSKIYKHIDDPTFLVSLKVVRLDLPESPKDVFRGICFTPK